MKKAGQIDHQNCPIGTRYNGQAKNCSRDIKKTENNSYAMVDKNIMLLR